MPSKDFLTVSDIAHELGLTERTIRAMFHSKKLHGRIIGGKYIMTRDALREYVNGK